MMLGNFKFQIRHLWAGRGCLVVLLVVAVALAACPGWSQTPADSGGPSLPTGQSVSGRTQAGMTESDGRTASGTSARARPAPSSRSASWGDEGELIQLEDMLIKGEIAQPNVAITVSRAEPIFREMDLEPNGGEGMGNLDLSGLKGNVPPLERMAGWREMLKRPRQ
jgi:hypothetical protein